MWNYLYAIFVCVLVFLTPIYNTFLAVYEINNASGQFQYLAILIFIFAVILYTKEVIIANSSIPFSHYKILIGALIILLLYMLSGAIYAEMPHEYTSSLLRFGSTGTAAFLGGLLLNQKGKLKLVCKILPWFSFVITIFTAIYGYSGTAIVHDEDLGWNYQTISYCMADCFLFHSFYLLYAQRDRNNIVANSLMIAAIIANLFLCLNAGGRGASVLLIFSICFLIYKFLCNSKFKKINSISTVFLIIIGLFYISQAFNLFDSDGFFRITHMFEQNTEERTSSYTEAIDFWMESPLWGFGIGSIWHTVGYYSHNIICDLLAEGGIILLTIMGWITIRAMRLLFKASTFDSNYYFVIFYAFTGLGMLMFSSYWIYSEALWFMIASAFTLQDNKENYSE